MLEMSEEQRTLAGLGHGLPGVIARELAAQFGGAQKSDPGLIGDLESEGNLALCMAAQRWQAGRGVGFREFAAICIRRRCYTLLKSRGRTLRHEIPTQAAPRVFEPVSVSESIEAGLVARELRLSVSRLPEQQRQALELRSVMGYTFKEIARIQGVSLSCAFARWQAGLATIRAAEAGERGGESVAGTHDDGAPIPGAELESVTKGRLFPGKVE